MMAPEGGRAVQCSGRRIKCDARPTPAATSTPIDVNYQLEQFLGNHGLNQLISHVF